MLYANENISKALRERYVLHWKSVRPVPVIRIDFGDGRKIERTITGNSIHYVLDADGRPIDAIPGLYGPKAFLHQLAWAENVATKCAGLKGNDRERVLSVCHSDEMQKTQRAWSEDLAILNAPKPASKDSAGLDTAWNASRLAKSKSAIEYPMLTAMKLSPTNESSTDEKAWAGLAALHADDARLDAASTTMVGVKYPDADSAGQLAMSKKIVENPLLRVVRNLERSIAEDTVRNEYQLHSKIHAWFALGEAQHNVDVLNDRVYTELFLTPSSDPWLGLVPQNTYTALENNGVIVPAEYCK